MLICSKLHYGQHDLDCFYALHSLVLELGYSIISNFSNSQGTTYSHVHCKGYEAGGNCDLENVHKKKKLNETLMAATQTTQ